MRVEHVVVFSGSELHVVEVVTVLTMFNLDLAKAESVVVEVVAYCVHVEDVIVIKDVSCKQDLLQVLRVVRRLHEGDLQVHDIVTVIVDVDEVYFEDVRVYIVFIEDDVVVGFLLV